MTRPLTAATPPYRHTAHAKETAMPQETFDGAFPAARAGV